MTATVYLSFTQTAVWADNTSATMNTMSYILYTSDWWDNFYDDVYTYSLTISIAFVSFNEIEYEDDNLLLLLQAPEGS